MAITIKSLGLSYPSFKLYDVTFYDSTITTLVTAKANVVDNWISDMEYLHHRHLSHLVVGLDCEWCAEWNRGVRDSCKPATLQLCIGRNGLIFQVMNSAEIPQSLRNFLSNKVYTFVGVGVGEDARKLHRHYGLQVSKTKELGHLAVDLYGDETLYKAGLKRLVSVVLKVEMDKPKQVTLSNWAWKSLSLPQVQYACVDAFASFEVARTINTESRKKKASHSTIPNTTDMSKYDWYYD